MNERFALGLLVHEGPMDIHYVYPGDHMSPTKVFQSNRSQAVRLPKALEFPTDVREVFVRRLGRSRVITPVNATWDDFFESPGVDLGERVQPEAQARKAF